MNLRDTIGNIEMVSEFRLGNIELVLFNLKMYLSSTPPMPLSRHACISHNSFPCLPSFPEPINDFDGNYLGLK
jgi:hypothetical protein